MCSIKQLPANSVRLLKSSQVITSVASVVKELVENSLDAKAMCIDIKLENSGLDKVEVRDNGTGIAAEDAVYMAQPSYTSKITSHHDLEHLETYGFRGEALAALCSVADVTIITKTAGTNVAFAYTLNRTGQVVSSKPSPLESGTVVTATNLFKNMPVRRKFYDTSKKKKTELKRSEDIIMSFSVIHPGIRFSLYHNRTIIWQKPGLSSTRDCLMQILGPSVVNSMEYLTSPLEGNKPLCEAYLPKRECIPASRSLSDRSFIFVNQRPIQCKEIEKLLVKYYCQNSGERKLRFPACFISINLPPSSFDVNVEPNKTAVLFHDQENVINSVQEILEKFYGSVNDNEETKSSNTSDSATNDQPAKSKSQASVKKHSTKSIVNGNADSSSILNDHSHPVIQNCSKDVENSRQECEEEDSVLRAIFSTLDPLDEDLNLPTQVTSASRILSSEKDSLQTVKNPVASNLSEALNDCVVVGETLKKDSEQSRENSEKNIANPCDDSMIKPSEQSRENESRGRNETVGPIASHVPINKPNLVPQKDLKNNDLNTTSIKERVEAAKQSKLTAFENPELIKGYASRVGAKDMDSSDDIAEMWSRGNFRNLEGKIIENVQLLRPDNGMKRCEPPAKLRNSPPTSPVKKKNKVVEELSQTQVFDMIYSKVVKRPVNAFSYFYRERRQDVLLEFPNADKEKIAEILTNEWKQLSSPEKDKYIQLAERGQKRQEKSFELALPPNDATLSGNKSTEIMPKILTTVQTKSNVNKKCAKKDVPLNFDLPHLKERFEKLRESQSQEDGSSKNANSLNLIGDLPTGEIWFASYKNQLLAISHRHIKENIVFNRLMATHNFPMETLEEPIRICHSSFPNQLWQVLLSLKTEEQFGYKHIIDRRLVANGFDIQYVSVEGLPIKEVEIVRLATSYIIEVVSILQDILEAIASQPSASLLDTRTPSAIEYIRREATHITGKSASRVTRDELQDLISLLKLKFTTPPTTCIHSRPIYEFIFDLNSIPLTQAGT